MKLEILYERIKSEMPALLYISGTSCAGKSTFAHKLRDNLGYEIIELDKIVVGSVIRPQGLVDPGAVFAEVYRNRDQRQLIDPFVAAAKQVISTKLTQNQPIAIEGALANAETLSDIFSDYPDFMFIYFHPKNLEIYRRNLTNRFMLADKDVSSGLPKHFWSLIDEKEFELFCNTRVITPGLEQSIAAFALSSQQESVGRLANFKATFDRITVVEV